VPPDTKLAIEAYAPFVDPVRFSVHGFRQMIEHEPEWYVAQGFDYLVFSQGMYGRFYQDPERYNHEVTLYDRLFETFELQVAFTTDVTEVKIYKISHGK
jgi:hypothetical protein